MHHWLVVVTEYAVLVIETMATLIVIIGTVEAFIDGIRILPSSKTSHEKGEIWQRYARWLIAGLTFQLAADIIETSIGTTWQSIAKLGAVAVIRTFLNYFLERDLREVRKRLRAPSPAEE